MPRTLFYILMTSNSLLHRVQTGSGSDLPRYSFGHWIPEGKTAGAWSILPTSIQYRGLEYSEFWFISYRFFNCVQWCDWTMLNESMSNVSMVLSEDVARIIEKKHLDGSRFEPGTSPECETGASSRGLVFSNRDNFASFPPTIKNIFSHPFVPVRSPLDTNCSVATVWWFWT